MSKTEKSGNDIPTSPKASPPKAWVQHENKEVNMSEFKKKNYSVNSLKTVSCYIYKV